LLFTFSIQNVSLSLFLLKLSMRHVEVDEFKRVFIQPYLTWLLFAHTHRHHKHDNSSNFSDILYAQHFFSSVPKMLAHAAYTPLLELMTFKNAIETTLVRSVRFLSHTSLSFPRAFVYAAVVLKEITYIHRART
jgi:hypothetical protein